VARKRISASGIIKSFGLVFGDIGTSPIYTLTIIFLLTPPTEANVIGVLSLVVWTMIILVTVEYAWLAMSLSKRGEGGTIVLREILVPLLKSGRKAAFVTLLSFIGISLLIGDGVITPAISILSAVEGMRYVPGFEDVRQETVVFIAAAIAFVLFAFQRKGADKVSFAFGPVMLLWFLALSVSGLFSVLEAPQVAKAISPHYAIGFLATHGLPGFFVLSEVILCATGSEALYADMGHLGRGPILNAWYLVFMALLLNYLGQGAFVIAHPEAKNLLFEMVLSQASVLYVPFLLLSIIATIIASQAMISGIFSVVYQGINTHILPLFKVKYTSTELHSQIYIGAVNWFLLFSVLFIMYEFRESHNLAAAYGLAVNGDMVITGTMMTLIFSLKGMRFKAAAAVFVLIVDIIFLLANFMKIPHGGYWSIIIASIPLAVILIYTKGQKKLYGSLTPMRIGEFLQIFNFRYSNETRLRGTALYFTKYAGAIPPYIYNNMFMNGIIYEDNILVTLERRDDPFGVTGFFREDLAPGLRLFEIQYGYMEVFDIEEVLAEAGIAEKVIFYGVDEISTENPAWRIFSFIKRVGPTFVKFHNLPSFKLHGIVTRVKM